MTGQCKHRSLLYRFGVNVYVVEWRRRDWCKVLIMTVVWGVHLGVCQVSVRYMMSHIRGYTLHSHVGMRHLYCNTTLFCCCVSCLPFTPYHYLRSYQDRYLCSIESFNLLRHTLFLYLMFYLCSIESFNLIWHTLFLFMLFYLCSIESFNLLWHTLFLYMLFYLCSIGSFHITWHSLFL